MGTQRFGIRWSAQAIALGDGVQLDFSTADMDAHQQHLHWKCNTVEVTDTIWCPRRALADIVITLQMNVFPWQTLLVPISAWR